MVAGPSSPNLLHAGEEGAKSKQWGVNGRSWEGGGGGRGGGGGGLRGGGAGSPDLGPVDSTGRTGGGRRRVHSPVVFKVLVDGGATDCAGSGRMWRSLGGD